MKTNALVFDRVRKSFNETIALYDVSLEVDYGEIFGLLGQNGAGKTTLIRVALGMIHPDEGWVRVFDQKPQPMLLDRIGYLPEERGLPRRAKAIDVLEYMARLKGRSAHDARQLASYWLERVELGAHAKKHYEMLSKGTAQRLQIAATLMTSPELAILDEPFSGLDPLNMELIRSLLIERRNQGFATILSTHHMHSVESLCDRVALIHRGKRLIYGTIEEVFHQDAAQRSMNEIFIHAVNQGDL